MKNKTFTNPTLERDTCLSANKATCTYIFKRSHLEWTWYTKILELSNIKHGITTKEGI